MIEISCVNDGWVGTSSQRMELAVKHSIACQKEHVKINEHFQIMLFRHSHVSFHFPQQLINSTQTLSTLYKLAKAKLPNAVILKIPHYLSPSLPVFPPHAPPQLYYLPPNVSLKYLFHFGCFAPYASIPLYPLGASSLPYPFPSS